MFFLRILPLLVIACSLFLGFFDTAVAQEENPLVVKVGSISITNEDLQREIQKLMPMQVSYHGGIKPEKLEKVKQDARKNLIDRAYKFQYAISEEIALDPVAFDEAWSAYVQKMNGRDIPPEEIEKIKARFYQDMLAQKAEAVAVDAKVSVTDEEIREYYNQNKEKYKRPRLYTASHIFLKVDPSASLEDKAKRREQAEELYAKAAAGEDFYNLAYYNSDDRTRYVGGSLGKFHAGQTVREFDAALSTMKAGEVSKPIQTIYGFHIIKLDDVEESRVLSFDEVEGMLKQQVRDSRRMEIYQAWMDDLVKRYPLESYDKE